LENELPEGPTAEVVCLVMPVAGSTWVTCPRLHRESVSTPVCPLTSVTLIDEYATVP